MELLLTLPIVLPMAAFLVYIATAKRPSALPIEPGRWKDMNPPSSQEMAPTAARVSPSARQRLSGGIEGTPTESLEIMQEIAELRTRLETLTDRLDELTAAAKDGSGQSSRKAA
jgi:hypothetical protein